MKRLICEVCGSPDLIKQDGVFECQSCGCKFSIDEVRKMLVEGTVEVTGNISVIGEVNIAGIASPDALFQRAKEFYKNEEYASAEEYCNRVLDIDPGHPEAKKMYSMLHIIPKVGDIYYGKVVRILAFGAFVEIAPGKEGMIHISKITDHHIDRVDEILHPGDMTLAKVIQIDKQGRINLSRIDAIKERQKSENRDEKIYKINRKDFAVKNTLSEKEEYLKEKKKLEAELTQLKQKCSIPEFTLSLRRKIVLERKIVDLKNKMPGWGNKKNAVIQDEIEKLEKQIPSYSMIENEMREFERTHKSEMDGIRKRIAELDLFVSELD